MLYLRTAAIFAVSVVAYAQTADTDRTGTSKSSQASQRNSGSTINTKGGTLTSADRTFIENAMKGGRAEVAMGRMAVERASDPAVKQFGQMMIDDHSKANTELEALARQKGVSPPPEASDAKQSQLANMRGDQFDKAYVSMMLADHQKDVAEFQKQARSASDPDVKNFAAKTLPTLQMHLEHVKSLSSLKKG